MAEALSEQAERAADLVWAYRSTEYPVDKLEKALSMPRHEAVWLLKDLEKAGHGRFVVGRRDHVSRFVRGPERPQKTAANSTPPPNPEAVDESVVGGQTLILMRSTPVKIVVPADLTRAEADKIARWLDVIVHD